MKAPPFLRDPAGDPSAMRIGMFMTLVVALFLITADAFGWTSRPMSFETLLLMFGGAFGGKVLQRFAETRGGEG